MCEGFSCLVMRDGSIYWTEPDYEKNISHSTIIERLGIKEDESPLDRNFVRVEFPEWTEKSFRWDEDSTLPAWLDEEEAKEKCSKLMLRVKKVMNEQRNALLPAVRKCRNDLVTEYHSCSDGNRKQRIVLLHGLLSQEESYLETQRYDPQVFFKLPGFLKPEKAK